MSSHESMQISAMELVTLRAGVQVAEQALEEAVEDWNQAQQAVDGAKDGDTNLAALAAKTACLGKITAKIHHLEEAKRALKQAQRVQDTNLAALKADFLVAKQAVNHDLEEAERAFKEAQRVLDIKLAALKAVVQVAGQALNEAVEDWKHALQAVDGAKDDDTKLAALAAEEACFGKISAKIHDLEETCKAEEVYQKLKWKKAEMFTSRLATIWMAKIKPLSETTNESDGDSEETESDEGHVNTQAIVVTQEIENVVDARKQIEMVQDDYGGDDYGDDGYMDVPEDRFTTASNVDLLPNITPLQAAGSQGLGQSQAQAPDSRVATGSSDDDEEEVMVDLENTHLGRITARWINPDYRRPGVYVTPSRAAGSQGVGQAQAPVTPYVTQAPDSGSSDDDELMVDLENTHLGQITTRWTNPDYRRPRV